MLEFRKNSIFTVSGRTVFCEKRVNRALTFKSKLCAEALKNLKDFCSFKLGVSLYSHLVGSYPELLGFGCKFALCGVGEGSVLRVRGLPRTISSQFYWA